MSSVAWWRWIVPFTGAVCGIAFAWSASQVYLSVRDDAESAAPSVAGSPGDRRLARILDAHLFKLQPAGYGAAAAAGGVELKGTFSGAGGAASYAILAAPGQPEKSYAIGDRLADGAEIAAIAAGSVTLRRGGAETVLHLRQEETETGR